MREPPLRPTSPLPHGYFLIRSSFHFFMLPAAYFLLTHYLLRRPLDSLTSVLCVAAEADAMADHTAAFIDECFSPAVHRASHAEVSK